MRILAIKGSPRKKSNSSVLLEAFLEHAPYNSQIHVFEAYRLKIYPCRGCSLCKNGSCVLLDDMAEIYQILQDVDVLVLSHPVYFYGPPAPVKSLIDRSQPFWYEKYVHKRDVKPKRGVLINVSASGGGKVFEASRLIAKVWFNTLNAEFSLHLAFDGLEEEGEVLGRQDILEKVSGESARFFAQAA